MDDVTKSGNLGERRTRGRPFAQGNPGRKPGSKNKTTLIGQALLKEAEEDLLRKAIEMAKAGDGPMLKFLLDRILPKERSIQVELPKLLVASTRSTRWERSSKRSVPGRSLRMKVLPSRRS